MKNTLEKIKNRLDKAEDQISELEYKVEKAPSQSSKTKRTKKEQA